MSWLHDELKLWAYKPGWTMRLIEAERTDRISYAGHNAEATLEIVAMVPDSYHPSRVIPVKGHIPVPFYFSYGDPQHQTESFGHWLMCGIEDMERHELREWLRRNGELYDDPHKKGARP